MHLLFSDFLSKSALFTSRRVFLSTVPPVVSASHTAESEILPKQDSNIVILDDEEDGSQPKLSASETPKVQEEEKPSSQKLGRYNIFS